jgi:hypothetical protein
VWAAGFAAAANDMTAGDSAAISAIASNATICAFIRYPFGNKVFRKYKSRFLKAVQDVVVLNHSNHSSFRGCHGQSPAIKGHFASRRRDHLQILELISSASDDAPRPGSPHTSRIDLNKLGLRRVILPKQSDTSNLNTKLRAALVSHSKTMVHRSIHGELCHEPKESYLSRRSV